MSESQPGPKFTSKRPPPLLQLPPSAHLKDEESPLTASTLRDRSPLFTGLLLSPKTLTAFPLPPTTRRAEPERKKSSKQKRSDKAMYHLPGALQSLESVESYQYGVAHGTGDSLDETEREGGEEINNGNQTNPAKLTSSRQPYYRTSSYGTTSRSGLDSSEDEAAPTPIRQKSSSDKLRKRASSRASRLSKKTTTSTASKHHPRRPSTSMSTLAPSVYEDALDASYAYADGDDEASDAESVRTDKWIAFSENTTNTAEENNEQSVRSTTPCYSPDTTVVIPQPILPSSYLTQQGATSPLPISRASSTASKRGSIRLSFQRQRIRSPSLHSSSGSGSMSSAGRLDGTSTPTGYYGMHGVGMPGSLIMDSPPSSEDRHTPPALSQQQPRERAWFPKPLLLPAKSTERLGNPQTLASSSPACSPIRRSSSPLSYRGSEHDSATPTSAVPQTGNSISHGREAGANDTLSPSGNAASANAQAAFKHKPSESIYAELYEESLKSPSVHSFDLSATSAMEDVFHPAASTSFILEDEEDEDEPTDDVTETAKPLPSLPTPVRNEHPHTVIRHALSLEPVAECDEEPTYSFIKVQESSDEGEGHQQLDAGRRVSVGHPASFRRSLLIKQAESQGSPLRMSQSPDDVKPQAGPSQPKVVKTDKPVQKQAERKGKQSKHARTNSRESNKLVKPHRDSHASNTTYFTSAQRQRADSSPPIPLRIECTPVVPVKQKQKSRTTWIPKLLLAPKPRLSRSSTPVRSFSTPPGNGLVRSLKISDPYNAKHVQCGTLNHSVTRESPFGRRPASPVQGYFAVKQHHSKLSQDSADLPHSLSLSLHADSTTPPGVTFSPSSASSSFSTARSLFGDEPGTGKAVTTNEDTDVQGIGATVNDNAAAEGLWQNRIDTKESQANLGQKKHTHYSQTH